MSTGHRKSSPVFPGVRTIAIGFLAGIKDDELVRMKWRLYDELIKKKLLAKIGVAPPTIKSETTRTDTSALPTGGLRMEEA